ncbi:MAG TPA: DNA methyltransferase [Paenirhodobacter sp.]
MMPRLQIMKAMLKPSSVIAISIDGNELYHLGMMMDEVFRGNNRLGIINWEKTTAKNQARSLSVNTEYVLVYSKDKDLSKTGLLDRTEKSNARFRNPDGDNLGHVDKWRSQSMMQATSMKPRKLSAVLS